MYSVIVKVNKWLFMLGFILGKLFLFNFLKDDLINKMLKLF